MSSPFAAMVVTTGVTFVAIQAYPHTGIELKITLLPAAHHYPPRLEINLQT